MSAAASFSSALQASGGLIGLIGAFFDAPDRHPRAACSKGLYPIQKFPHVLGSEAAGEIGALPTVATGPAACSALECELAE